MPPMRNVRSRPSASFIPPPPRRAGGRRSTRRHRRPSPRRSAQRSARAGPPRRRAASSRHPHRPARVVAGFAALLIRVGARDQVAHPFAERLQFRRQDVGLGGGRSAAEEGHEHLEGAHAKAVIALEVAREGAAQLLRPTSLHGAVAALGPPSGGGEVRRLCDSRAPARPRRRPSVVVERIAGVGAVVDAVRAHPVPPLRSDERAATRARLAAR
jgi:hypothetical protein